MTRSSEIDVVCPYCDRSAVLVDDAEVYQMSYGGKVWLCRPCNAWVGCHRNSPRHAALGRLADKDLRQLKIQAHALFDPIWEAAMRHRKWGKTRARRAAYEWLAGEMGIYITDCHIGMFDEQQCRRAIDVCGKVGRREP